MSHSDDFSRFIDEATHGSRLRVESDLGGGFVRLRVSEAERRQAKQDIRCVEDAVVEMLRNARDARARMIFMATTRSGALRRIVMVDDGCGVPEHLQEAVFDPRVTSKLDSMVMDDWGVHGRGMALYSIRANAEEARIAASVEGKGSAFCVTFDATRIPERRDQSTLPSLVKGEDGMWSVGTGPHNIARIVAEFSLANRQACTVYCGSAVEVAATLYAFGIHVRGATERMDSAIEEVAPAKRLARAGNALEFASIAESLGLELSSRSAHRILQGEVPPLAPFLETLHKEKADEEKRKKKADLSRDFRGLKIAADDLEEFANELSAVYAALARRYYLEPDVQPMLRVSHDGLHVTFPVRKL